MKPMDETLGLIESWIELTNHRGAANPIANILDYVLLITEVEKVENIIFTFAHMFASEPRDGILGHQFIKRLESFAACYSQFLLLADFF
jgi:hypothetical protein